MQTETGGDEKREVLPAWGFPEIEVRNRGWQGAPVRKGKGGLEGNPQNRAGEQQNLVLRLYLRQTSQR